MSKLLLLISTFYQCDVAATHDLLSYEEHIACGLIYAEVKAQFLTDEERAMTGELSFSERGPLLLAGFQRFKDWEAANPELVQQLHFMAKAKVLGDDTV